MLHDASSSHKHFHNVSIITVVQKLLNYVLLIVLEERENKLVKSEKKCKNIAYKRKQKEKRNYENVSEDMKLVKFVLI